MSLRGIEPVSILFANVQHVECRISMFNLPAYTIQQLMNSSQKRKNPDWHLIHHCLLFIYLFICIFIYVCLFVGGLEVFSCYIAEDYFISKAIFNRLVTAVVLPFNLTVSIFTLPFSWLPKWKLHCQVCNTYLFITFWMLYFIAGVWKWFLVAIQPCRIQLATLF